MRNLGKENQGLAGFNLKSVCSDAQIGTEPALLFIKRDVEMGVALSVDD